MSITEERITTIEELDGSQVAWQVDAACRAVANAGELFFSEELHDIAAAKRICAECPVIAPCLEGAIARSEPCGVWAASCSRAARS